MQTEANISDPDGFTRCSECALRPHGGRERGPNSRLILLLANQIGDLQVLSACIAAARNNVLRSRPNTVRAWPDSARRLPRKCALSMPQPGGPEALVVREVPQPSLPPARAHPRAAAGGSATYCNVAASTVAAGRADYPGLEVSGTVSAIGADVNEFAVGDRVCALLQGGGYADTARRRSDRRCTSCGHRSQDTRFPRRSSRCGATSSKSGGSPLATLLVHGGTSASACDPARASVRHRVMTTAGSEKRRFCAGSAPARDQLSREDFVAAVICATGGIGVDVVLDMVAATTCSVT